MAEQSQQHLLYNELAEWWPLISPPQEYAEEAAFAAGLLRSGSISAHEVLELGSGGGHNALHLKRQFALTLVDVSEPMLAMSARLNPECEHVRGDMRTIRLGREFDAVFLHDAVSYLTTEDDLRQAVETAFTHCRAGGVAVFVPDDTDGQPVEGVSCGGGDAPDGRAARYLEWTWDPDPADTTIRTEYVFTLRDADGAVRVVHETHITGAFGRDTWLRLLADSGFEPVVVTEQTGEDRIPRDVFIGRRPPADSG